MSPEEQLITISERLGWTEVRYRTYEEIGGSAFSGLQGGYISGIHPVLKVVLAVPKYPYDLNDCREMEKSLTKDQIPVYFRNLVPSDKEWLDNSCWEFLCFATAAQRCEAFLKTMNLWKE